MSYKNLAAGTVLRKAGTDDCWTVDRAFPAMEGQTSYQTSFVGTEYRPKIIYSYQIGEGQPFEVVPQQPIGWHRRAAMVQIQAGQPR